MASTAMQEHDLFIGPTPIITNVDFKSRRDDWLENKTVNSWLISQSGEHAKRFITKPNSTFTKKLLSLKKAVIHFLVNSYKCRISLRDDPLQMQHG